MEPSILRSTKKKLNVNPDDTAFDIEIVDFINNAFGIINQLGVGPDLGFRITGEDELWDDLDLDVPMTELTRTIVFLRTRLLFDPPATSFVLTALQDQIKEHEIRLNMMREATEWADPNPPAEPVDV